MCCWNGGVCCQVECGQECGVSKSGAPSLGPGWWYTFCSSSNLGSLREVGDRYFFFPPGSRGGYGACEDPESTWQLSASHPLNPGLRGSLALFLTHTWS